MRFLSRKYVWTLLFLLIALGTVCPQTSSGVPPDNSTVQGPVEGANSGLSSLPAPSRSYFLGGIHVSAGAESNPSLLSTYSSQISSVANLLGNFTLRKDWRHLGTSIDYRGGDTLYRNYGDVKFNNQQFHRLGVDGVIRWTRGQLSFKDSYAYTRDQGFGSLSPSGTGDATNSGSQSFDATLFGLSYVSNRASAGVTESLTKRSSASFSAGYSFTRYIGNSEGLFNSQQASTQAGYSYQITRRNKIGFVYGYQDFQFIQSPQGVVTNSAQLVFQRRFTEHVDLVVGAGPDRIVTTGIGMTSQINATVQASLAYRRKRSDLQFSYNRQVTSGSGVYAGSLSDTAMASFDRRLSRSWQATLSGSYDRADGLGAGSFGALSPQSQYWLAEAAVHRRLGRSLSAFASYGYHYDSFLRCSGVQQGCGPAVNRNIILLGFDWSIRPVHLD